MKLAGDHINAIFELGGGVLLILNVIEILKAKCFQGIHLAPVLFFFFWGCWNLYYYPSLDQWWSFAGGIAVTSVNGIWLALAIYYKYIRQ